MTYEIFNCGYKDIPELWKSNVSDNGHGKEYADYLVVKHNGVTIAVYSDAMEPEDVYFSRDMKWIKPALISAYELGKKECISHSDYKIASHSESAGEVLEKGTQRILNRIQDLLPDRHDIRRIEVESILSRVVYEEAELRECRKR